MQIYQLTTDKRGTQYVSVRNEKELRDKMRAYIQNRVAKGAKLGHIIFSYHRCNPLPIPTGNE